MEWLELSWKFLVVRGVIGVVFGLCAMVWPLSTAVALVLLWGVLALVEGVGALLVAVRSKGTAPTVFFAVVGVVALVAAYFALFQPISTGTTLTWVLGLWLVFRGLMDAIAAFGGRVIGPRALALAGAALSVVVGVLFLANPGRAALSLAWLLGLMVLLWGVVFLAAGLMARRQLSSAARILA